MNSNIFSIRFKETYKRKGFTQASLSEKTGIKVSTIKKYSKQSNTALPSLETTKLLADTLGVDVAFLLGEIDVPHWKEQKVNDITGLSLSASQSLCELWEHRKDGYEVSPVDIPCHEIEILSEMISNEKFIELMQGIHRAKIAHKEYQEYLERLEETCKGLSQKEIQAVIKCDTDYNEYKNRYEGSRYMLGLTFNEIVKKICES